MMVTLIHKIIPIFLLKHILKNHPIKEIYQKKLTELEKKIIRNLI